MLVKTIELWSAAALLAVACIIPVSAQTPSGDTAAEKASRVYLWPGRIAPGSEHVTVQQRIVDSSTDPAHPDRNITGITQPYFVIYRPPYPNGSALLVTPGGGYRLIVLDNEGAELAPYFADAGGMTLFILRYRLPGDGHVNDRDAPLADAQRALRLIRAHAGEWRIDPHRIGVLGFSAGGHVAASLGTRFDEKVYRPVDAADRVSARPDFMLLGYPVIDMGRYAHPGSRERLLGKTPSPRAVATYSLQNRVTAATPPTFLLQAADDNVVPVDNSLLFFGALRRAGVPAELHIFPHGGHGFGVRVTHGPLATWPRLALCWIATTTGASQADADRWCSSLPDQEAKTAVSPTAK